MAYPNYPHNSGGYDPYAGGYSMPSVSPNGATAIIAGVLACLGVVANVLGGATSLWLGLDEYGSGLAEYDSTGLLGNSSYYDFMLVSGAIGLVVGLLLAIGAIMLFNRKPVGRTLVVVGCAVTILVQIAGVIVTMSIIGSLDADTGVLTSGLSGVFGLIFPVATAVLALLPATSRWIAYRPSETPQPNYPPAGYAQAGYTQQGYSQPGYPQTNFPQPGYPQGAAYPQPAPGGYPYPEPARAGYPVYAPQSANPQPGPAYPSAPFPQPDPSAGSVEDPWKRPGAW